MNKRILPLLLASMITLSAAAEIAPPPPPPVPCANGHGPAPLPTTESIQHLLDLTHADKLLSAMQPDLNAMLKTELDKATQGHELSNEQYQLALSYRNKADALMKSPAMQEQMRRALADAWIYRFTQQQVDAIIVFYKSPAGQAYAEQMPLAMQTTVTNLDGKASPLRREMQALVEEFKARLAELSPAKS